MSEDDREAKAEKELAEFYEESPLYSWLEITAIPQGTPFRYPRAIVLQCGICGEKRTFKKDAFEKTLNFNFYYAICYKCAYCDSFCYKYYVQFDSHNSKYRKIGQHPRYEIEMDPDLKIFLGNDVEIYQRGLECEKLGYGIGAYVYYRRIVERNMNSLLELIIDIKKKHGEDTTEIGKTLNSNALMRKIEAAREEMPPILKIEGMNPMKTLAGALSIRIHKGSEEECLIRAIKIRKALVFLIGSLQSHIRRRERYITDIRDIEKDRGTTPSENEGK